MAAPEKTPAEKAKETRAANAANKEIVDAANAQVGSKDAAGTHMISEGPVSDELGKGGNPPPNPPVATEVPGAEEQEAPPPPNPPDTGSPVPDDEDRNGFPHAEVLEDPQDQTAREERGRPGPQPAGSGPMRKRFRELMQKFWGDEITDEEFDELSNMQGPNPFRQATPTQELPTAPARNADGSVDAFPGQVEGTTQGQAPFEEETVTFNSEGHPELKQVLPSSETVQFHGGLYTTSNAEEIRMLRQRINQPGALYYEDDPVAILRCPFCKFTSPSESRLKQHISKVH